VGIGTSSPAGKLDISSNGLYTTLNISNTYSNASARNWAIASNSQNFGDLNFWVSNAQNGNPISAGTTKMTLDSSGNLLVNTTAVVGSGKLSIIASGATSNAIVLKNSDTGNNIGYMIFKNSNGDNAGYINQTGSTTVAFTSVSDYRLKENVAPMIGALNKVAQLNPVTYTWKQDGTTGQGFIAHELQAVVPDCVVGEKDDVNEDGTIKPQGIDTSFLVATLTAAIQELNAKVTSLEAQLGA
jgi:hypothetical protein